MTLAAEFDRAQRLHQEGKLREAFMRYDAVIKADPQHAAALHYSGVVLLQAGKHVEAIARIRASIGIDPASPDAWSNLALALQSVDRGEAAVNALKEAARLSPRSVEIWSNLAGAQLAVRQFVDAETSARQAVATEATHAAAWHNLALALAGRGAILQALDAATRAAATARDIAAYAGHKAQLELALGDAEAAQATLVAALARQPANAALRFERAAVHEQRGDLVAAADCYEQVLRVDPNHGAALSQFTFLRMRMADWRALPALRERLRKGVPAGSAPLSPFVLLSQPTSRVEQRRAAEAWTAALTRPAPPSAPRLLSGARLKLAYLSADFHSHATAYLATGMFEQHDRRSFEVTAYSTGPDDGSPMRARVVKAFDRFVDAAGWPAQRIAEAIRADGIDILVDLKGHTEGAPPGVLALRPAPIQVHYLGYPGTLGGTLADYLIADDVVAPPDDQPDYAETLVQLPGSYQVNDRQRPVATAAPRESLGLPPDALVLCCFNATYKLNPEVMDAWARILLAVPGAVLWLLARGDRDPAIGNLRQEAGARAIDPARLIFAPARPNAEYLALFSHADLFLDTWPYNAHTTASDALWCGCPLVTWRGESFAGRVAASLLTAVGLPELIARDVDDYVALAIALAQDHGRRAGMRELLLGAGRQSPLFDTAATTATLEAAYLNMAEQYRRRSRRPFRVEPRE
ncbi:MAG: tetratricopeptide repeat protein [Betaproteobacteria bacterium]